MIRYILPLFLLLTLDALSETDSVRIYRLGQVTVTDVKEKEASVFNSELSRISHSAVKRSDAASAAELRQVIPSVNIRTNSRGEALLFVRGAGERQLGLFFDGALLNIPWDNRIDLNFIPTDLIGSMTLNKSGSSSMYGPNILGGALNIATFERGEEGLGAAARLQYSDVGNSSLALNLNARSGAMNYLASVSYLDNKGLKLPEGGNTPAIVLNQDMGDKYITNSDMNRMSGYFRAEREFSRRFTLGASLNYTKGEKGVTPENHIAAEEARKWRYPDWDRLILTLNSELAFNDERTDFLKLTYWSDRFGQAINEYDTLAYQTPTRVQTDDDMTHGIRLNNQYTLDSNQRLNLVANVILTSHTEKIDNDPQTDFAQNTFSLGAEYNVMIGALRLAAGATFDHNNVGEAGNFTDSAREAVSAGGGFLTLNYNLNDNTYLFTNLSYRNRFPTLREAYSGALNRFTINPALKPESGLLTDIGIGHRMEDFSAEASFFMNMYKDLIVQINDPNDPQGRKRMRINLNEADISGVDLGAKWYYENLTVGGSLTYYMYDTFSEEANKNKIEYQPDFTFNLTAGYKFDFGLHPMLELDMIGKQYGLDANNDGNFSAVDGTTVLNFRAGYLLPDMIAGNLNEVYVRVNNIGDIYRLTQLGIPSAGRTIFFGLIANI